MKKTVKFELFGPNQFIYFDILRLAELEKALDASILKIIAEKEVGIGFCIAALSIGLKHHYNKPLDFYAKKIEEYLDAGGAFQDIVTPIIEAIMKSGLFGKVEEISEDEEKNVMEETE